jgi:hypothetical protein
MAIARSAGRSEVVFGFHAGSVDFDDLVKRVAFADRNDEEGEHYFVMDRSEGSEEEAVPDMTNVYIERDEQGWGGYGGIEDVVLERESLTVRLGARMATRMGQHDQIRITFDLNASQFRELRYVLCLIMRGYESQLECRA